MQYLEVVDNQGRRRQIPLDRSRIIIGREPTCDVHLPHPGVSRRHAQLQLTEKGLWLLQDLNSRNHVYLDNRPIEQVVLSPRRHFRIADYWLTLHEALPETNELKGIPEEQEDTADTASALDGGWLEQLHLFQRSMFQIGDGPLVLEGLAREFQRVLQPRAMAIGLVQQENYAWEFRQGENDEDSFQQNLAEANRKATEEHSTFQAWTPGPGGNNKGAAGTSTVCMLFPLKGRQKIIGHVFVQGPQYAKLPKILRYYLSLAAYHAGLLWDNIQLGGHQQAHLEFVKELEHARRIQIGLFPNTFDIDDRLDAYGVNLPSAQVSGDYYDLLRTGSHTVAFVIADAMGHGMPAALMMAAVRAALRMGLKLGLPWPAIFQGLDDLILSAGADTFVTGLVGQLDFAAHELHLVTAGHPLPSILVDGQPLAVPDHCYTRPWGLDLESSWQVARLPLGRRPWSILCYTDGVTDTGSRSQRATGAQRIAAYHQQNFLLTAEDLCQGVLNHVAVHPSDSSLGDDQTVLVLRSAL